MTDLQCVFDEKERAEIIESINDADLSSLLDILELRDRAKERVREHGGPRRWPQKTNKETP